MVDSNVTLIANIINPEIMGDMITEKVNSKVRVLPYAKLDTTLQGQAGDTITVPKTAYITLIAHQPIMPAHGKLSRIS